MSALDATGIRGEHRRLLATFREFLDPLTTGADPAAGEALRAAVAFLRQGVLAFAHREEEALLAGGGRLEDAALEHAFLAAEIDRLGQEVRRLTGAHGRGAEERDRSLARIRELAYRIEAVLEVHLLKEEENDTPEPPPAAPAAEERAHTGVLTPTEVEGFLRRHRWATLSTVGDGRPYAVPVSYAFDGEGFYFATGSGRKAHNLERCPHVCLTVAEVAGPNDWCSVIASGDALRVGPPAERIRALRLLARTRPGAPGGRDLARLLSARVFRVVPCEVTGRAQGRVASAPAGRGEGGTLVAPVPGARA
ncbi:MAG TPA: pyridoxamine 5'-phosphate oxidase family protein [Longimicrobiaceae bacterium]|nr:pyridoxamine 5'-phosphate oxidase family protein [Longimicrobiaceae bacterium]